ncbi:protein OSB2, chloroplastic-like [Malania oleifera]|uniref:protein OSB2, chloroplastic-like n=1 Tax=Malania oleifera TaxID=397392 RepID=UPI0025ADAE9F|nr:protein OSB2, chloroplastic-like [Malania oleifera]
MRMNMLCRALVHAVSPSSPTKQGALAQSLILLDQSLSAFSSSSSSLYSTITTTSSLKEKKHIKQKSLESASASASSSTLSPPQPPSPNGSELARQGERDKGKEIEKSLRMNVSADWPRPSEIPWQAKVVNSVNLIGTVRAPVRFLDSSGRKHYAGTVISQDTISDAPPLWIPVIFEGDLAHIAACHLKEKDCVYIVGKLNADPSPFTASKGQTNIQVMACSINFVQPPSPVKKIFAPQMQEGLAFDKSDRVSKDEHSTLSLWRDLIHNPKDWWDYRASKLSGLVNPRYPDFKSKDGKSLWLDRAPEWVLPGLDGLDFDTQIRKPKQVNKSKVNELWKNLVENPDKWWDNRSSKAKEKSPDFKHKDTGEALWLSDSPAWVLSKLPAIKTKQDAATWIHC